MAFFINSWIFWKCTLLLWRLLTALINMSYTMIVSHEMYYMYLYLYMLYPSNEENNTVYQYIEDILYLLCGIFSVKTCTLNFLLSLDHFMLTIKRRFFFFFFWKVNLKSWIIFWDIQYSDYRYPLYVSNTYTVYILCNICV